MLRSSSEIQGGVGAEGLGCGVDCEAASDALAAQVVAAWDLGRVGQQPVDLACDVALEAAHDLAAGLAFALAAPGVVDGALIAAESGEGDVNLPGYCAGSDP